MKTKRTFALLLAIAASLALAACGGSTGGEQPEASGELKTMGDAMAVETGSTSAAWDAAHYVYVFDNNGTTTRVVCDLTEELSEQIDDALFNDGGGEDAVRELLASLPLVSVEDLSGGIPDQETMDQLVGRTGQDLLDDGYEIWGSSFNGEDVSFTLVKGLYQYEVTFEADPAQLDSDDLEGVMPGLTVTSVTYAGVSDHATDLSYKP